MAPKLIQRLRDNLRLYQLVLRHQRTPWLAGALLGAAGAYLLSPIDIIPDFIPVIGYLDDIIIVPLLVLLAIRLIPGEIVAECRAQMAAARPTSTGTETTTGLRLG